MQTEYARPPKMRGVQGVLSPPFRIGSVSRWAHPPRSLMPLLQKAATPSPGRRGDTPEQGLGHLHRKSALPNGHVLDMVVSPLKPKWTIL